MWDVRTFFSDMAQTKPLVQEKLVMADPFVVLTDLGDLSVEFLNATGNEPSDLEIFPYTRYQDFYCANVHPDDYADLLAHLSSFYTPLDAEEKVITIRLKNRKGSYTRFLFRSSLYRGDTFKGLKVLSIAEKQLLLPGEVQKEKNKKQPTTDEYQHLVNSLDEGFCVLELIYDDKGEPVDYLYLETNSAFEKQSNFKNVTGKKVSELVAIPNKNWLTNFGEVARTGKPMRFEERNPNLGNSWFNLFSFKLKDPSGKRIGVIFRNVTNQKLAEEKLQELNEKLEKSDAQSTELLQTVFDTTSLGIAVLKPLYDENGEVTDFEYLRINKVLSRIYEGRDPIGNTVLNVSRHSVQLGIFDALKEVVSSGEPLDQELFFDLEGPHLWYRITARIQKDVLIATVEDISKRKAESLELEETMRFKQQLVVTSPETIMIINLNQFNVRYINKDLFPEVGMTKEKILGMPLPDILPYVHPRDREKVMEMHKKLVKASNEDIFDLELRLKLKGNTWHWFSVRAKIFHRRDEYWVDEYVLLVRNITQQKVTQKALLKAEKFSIQGEIARTLAHELRNPLASIKMTTEVLGKKLDEPEKEALQKYLNILNRSTTTLNNLVTGLLNSSNYVPAELQKEDLAEIVEATVVKAADRIYLSGIKVVKNYSGPYSILADREKLEIAILNILVNASEATVPGEGIIEISIVEDKTDFRLDVRDNGHGLEQEQVDHLFEAFYTNKNTGVGVGLSSVKNILEEHDAQVKVESVPNKGTCFSLFFNNVSRD